MPECESCGDDLTKQDKNTAGHYRERCQECIDAESRDIDESARRPPAQWLAEEPTPEGWE